MKKDARVKYTERVLKESLLRLLETKPVNKITVKEVCALAELNRATFYAHYTDCFDLFGQIENDLIAAFEESLRYVDGLDVTRLAEAIYDMIDSHLELCRVLIFQHQNATLLQKMISLAREKSMSYWRRYLKKASDDELELLFICLSNGLLHVVVEGYQQYDKATVIGFVNSMVRNALAAYL